MHVNATAVAATNPSMGWCLHKADCSCESSTTVPSEMDKSNVIPLQVLMIYISHS